MVGYSFTCCRTQPGTSSRRLADDLSLFPWLALHEQRFRVARSRFIWCFSDRGILKWILARFAHPGVLKISDELQNLPLYFSHQHHKTGSWWSLNTAKHQYTLTFAVATGNQGPWSPGLCFSLPAVKSFWHNIVFSSIFFPIAASCGNKHDAFGAAASEEPDNPASIRQDSFDCLSVDKQRQTVWLRTPHFSQMEKQSFGTTPGNWHRENRINQRGAGNRTRETV